MTELWKPVPGWPYEVSSTGLVRRTSPARGHTSPTRYLVPLKPRLVLGKGGATPYARVVLQDSPRRWCAFVHTLVLEAFVGPRPTPKHQCNHKNGVKLDNSPGNLEWVTATENIRHAFATGLNKPHEANAKISPDLVPIIRARHASGEWLFDLAREHGITGSAIGRMVRGETWPKAGGPITPADTTKTHCKRGHEFTPENTKVSLHKGRKCRTCAIEWDVRSRALKREASI